MSAKITKTSDDFVTFFFSVNSFHKNFSPHGSTRNR